MKNQKRHLVIILLTFVFISCKAQVKTNEDPSFKSSDDLKITAAKVNYDNDLEHHIFEIQVKGKAGESKPAPVGSVHGAPVLGYVFPTSLKPTDVGFSKTEGIVALALTSHPDFDDTPLWDENFDSDYANDGIIWHPHWVVLVKDERVPGRLSVKTFDTNDKSIKLPATNPGMPMYMDSPGYNVITRGNTIKVVVPKFRMNNITDFSFDGVAAYMQVNTKWKEKNMPMLGVYAVYSVASGDLSLPYKVNKIN
ncbi:hypothetical protein [Aquimarina sp. 2201CG5-10]|uniref:hypothetical protein n=1 Tax=Aquimarina callyspongiae TaxID=3098150 RepID=UPI002AB57A48|nr:hypothetical protein [Aquimarina sp. 2201CG5-10]MDY8134657.1 hypothetical protein [Aquimarina sp. 2201CG5-10]